MPRNKLGRAWIAQIASQVRRHGKRGASWYLMVNLPTGKRTMKSCGPGPAGKRLAATLRDRTNAKLLLGEYEAEQKPPVPTFDQFAGRFVHGMVGCRLSSIVEVENSLTAFARLTGLKDRPISEVTAQHVAEFVAKRSKERGRKPDSVLSPATLAKDIRVIKSALAAAVKQKLLAELPDLRPPRLDSKLHRAVSDEHFGMMYAAADRMTLPKPQHGTAAEFWRALLVFSYMAGARIGATLALTWEDLDLDAGTVVYRAENAKGRRDTKAALHPVVIEHLRPLRGDGPRVFDCRADRTTLTELLHAIQTAAGIDLRCNIPESRPHTCTTACRRYSWHDFRRAFACNNALKVPATVLQELMAHRSFQTTRVYLNLSERLRPVAHDLHVPAALTSASEANGVQPKG